jgi:site-specific DNA-methyltransferase (adenine-specific)
MSRLRQFQTALKNDIYTQWNLGYRNVLGVLPTGGGKSVLTGDIMRESNDAAVVAAHRGELVSQLSRALAAEGVRHRIIGPDSLRRDCISLQLAELGRSYHDPGSRVAVAGVDTLVKRDVSHDSWFRQVKLWVQDEAHHVQQNNKWGKIAGMFPNARGLGFTATPVRMGASGLGVHSGGVFDAMAVGPTGRELIHRGFLTDYRIFAPPSDVNYKNVGLSVTGDYSMPQLRAAVHASNRIVGDVITHYLRIAPGKLGITFAVDVEAAQELAQAYRAAGVPAEVLRCLRPGAHLLAFGGTRTFHRLACAIEDAGFEIRDCMQWLYGSGFPKSHDVSRAIDREEGATEAARQWDGHGTALKPAWEPIIVARKPLDGTVAQNVQQWGCGGLAIDACRIDGAPDPASWTAKRADGDGLGRLGQRSANVAAMNAGLIQPPTGRWPANVILDEEAGAMLDAQSGNRPGMSSGGKHKPGSKGGMFGAIDCEHTARGDSGGASRFFYQAKASRSERDAGLEEFEARSRAEATRRKEGSAGSKNAAAGAGGENCRNIHPTVKPIALARYLARLILPPIPDARMLTPFSGSGSEVIGALQAGWSHVDGIDSWDVAVRISRARIAHWASRIEPVQLDLAGE